MGRYKNHATKLQGHEFAISLDDRRQAPIATPGRCPAYFGAGWPAPEGRRATTRYDRIDLNDDGTKSLVTQYGYDTEPTQRQLLWEDHRYEGDKDPDESLYLDAGTTPPPWPPAYVAPDN